MPSARHVFPVTAVAMTVTMTMAAAGGLDVQLDQFTRRKLINTLINRIWRKRG